MNQGLRFIRPPQTALLRRTDAGMTIDFLSTAGVIQIDKRGLFGYIHIIQGSCPIIREVYVEKTFRWIVSAAFLVNIVLGVNVFAQETHTDTQMIEEEGGNMDTGEEMMEEGDETMEEDEEFMQEDTETMENGDEMPEENQGSVDTGDRN